MIKAEKKQYFVADQMNEPKLIEAHNEGMALQVYKELENDETLVRCHDLDKSNFDLMIFQFSEEAKNTIAGKEGYEKNEYLESLPGTKFYKVIKNKL